MKWKRMRQDEMGGDEMRGDEMRWEGMTLRGDGMRWAMRGGDEIMGGEGIKWGRG